jgi:hypothetical protein
MTTKTDKIHVEFEPALSTLREALEQELNTARAATNKLELDPAERLRAFDHCRALGELQDALHEYDYERDCLGRSYLHHEDAANYAVLELKHNDKWQ